MTKRLCASAFGTLSEMSVASRLFKIFRSKIITTFDGQRPGNIKDFLNNLRDASAHRTDQSGNFRQKAEYDVGNNQDPELAGYYANLEVPYGSDLATVKKAWKKLLQKYHPDLHSADAEKRQVANELTQGLNKAYDELRKRL